MPSYLEIIVFLPILAALAIGFGAPARFTAIGAAIINLIIGLYVAVSEFDLNLEGQAVFQQTSERVLMDSPKLALAFGVDGMSLILMLLTVIITVAAVWASPAENKIKGSAKLYYISSLLIAAGALGAFLSTDLFFLYAFHELALIPTFLMIGIFGYGENRKRTAWTITIYLGVGSLNFAGWFDRPLREHPRIELIFDSRHDCSCQRWRLHNSRGHSKLDLPSSACRFWSSRFALPLSQLGS